MSQFNENRQPEKDDFPSSEAAEPSISQRQLQEETKRPPGKDTKKLTKKPALKLNQDDLDTIAAHSSRLATPVHHVQHTPMNKPQELEFILTQLQTINKQLAREQQQEQTGFSGMPQVPLNWIRENIREIRTKSLQVDKLMGQLYEEIGKILQKLIDLRSEVSLYRQPLTTPTNLNLVAERLKQMQQQPQIPENILQELESPAHASEIEQRGFLSARSQQDEALTTLQANLKSAQPRPRPAIDVSENKSGSEEFNVFDESSLKENPLMHMMQTFQPEPVQIQLEAYWRPLQIHNDELIQRIEKLKTENHTLSLELASKNKQIAEVAISSMHKSAQMKQIKDHYKSLKVHTSELMEERNKLKQKFDDCVDIMQSQQRKIEELKGELDSKEEQIILMDKKQPSEQDMYEYVIRVVEECCNLINERKQVNLKTTSNSQFVDVPNEEGSRRLTYNDLDEECGSFVRHRGSCRVSHQSLDNHQNILEFCADLIKQRTSISDQKDATLKLTIQGNLPPQRSFMFALVPREALDPNSKRHREKQQIKRINSVGKTLQEFFNTCIFQLVFIENVVQSNQLVKTQGVAELQSLIHEFHDTIETSTERYDELLRIICDAFCKTQTSLIQDFDRHLKDAQRRLKHAKSKNLQLSKQLLKVQQ